MYRRKIPSLRRRRPYARRKTFRRTPYARARSTRRVYKRTSKRRILNITSVKKQDNMVPTAFNPDGQFPATRGFRAAGNVTTMLVWCATARDRVTAGDPNSTSLRTKDTVYMRGLKETVNAFNFQDAVSGQAANWKWRRICFTCKGLQTLLGTSQVAQETSNGWVRFLADQTSTTFGASLRDILFRGAQDVDWLTVMTAKTDNTRLTIKYDVTRTLNTGSGAKKFWNFKMWHPMNKNLVYVDDERGESEVSSNFSTLGKPGMGDYYVVDFLQCAQNNAADIIEFQPEATLYWHEK